MHSLIQLQRTLLLELPHLRLPVTPLPPYQLFPHTLQVQFPVKSQHFRHFLRLHLRLLHKFAPVESNRRSREGKRLFVLLFLGTDTVPLDSEGTRIGLSIFERNGRTHGDTIGPPLHNSVAIASIQLIKVLLPLDPLKPRRLSLPILPMIIPRILSTLLINLVNFILPFLIVKSLPSIMTAFIQIVLT